jgi:ABC-type branched-subunit amino acid transport system ATPase component
MLRLSEVDVYYGMVGALRNVSMEVREGEIVALLGANGAGKTTTLRAISGVVRPASGSIEFEGRAHRRAFPGAHSLPRNRSGARGAAGLSGAFSKGEPAHWDIFPPGPRQDSPGLRPRL